MIKCRDAIASKKTIIMTQVDDIIQMLTNLLEIPSSVITKRDLTIMLMAKNRDLVKGVRT